ncbi:MAG TPA: class I SAM-dependent methyltransferase, partial [Candidatus Aminicenantes bacterium]|nr:class I SAM-dependent methyltransferase [Candidatus Aminicenantes bacterium]
MAINVDSRGRTVEESVVLAMDGTDASLYPYLPYILQDIWQIGASPDLIIQVLRRRLPRKAGFRLLDLGCGKGAVSIPVAAAFDCSCLGIDAVEAFIA